MLHLDKKEIYLHPPLVRYEEAKCFEKETVMRRI